MTRHFLLNKRVSLTRPKTGYKSAIDPVFLAAAITPKPKQKILDLGTGIGTVALCLLARCPDVYVTGIDIQSELIDYAEKNAEKNKVATKTDFITVDHKVFAQDNPSYFNVVLMNPPYFDEENSRPSPDPKKAKANHGADIKGWVNSAHKALKTKGKLALIYPASEIGDVLAALQKGFGDIHLYPLWKKRGEDAKRIIVTAVKGSKTSLSYRPGLILHAKEETYTKAAEAILNEGKPLTI